MREIRLEDFTDRSGRRRRRADSGTEGTNAHSAGMKRRSGLDPAAVPTTKGRLPSVGNGVRRHAGKADPQQQGTPREARR